MPLSNFFLWIMLILAGLLGYQLLGAYLRNERKIYLARRRSAYTVHGSNSNRRTAANHIGSAGPVVGNQFHREGCIVKRSKTDFMSVGPARTGESMSANDLSYSLPAAAVRQPMEKYEIMAAAADCHHCA